MRARLARALSYIKRSESMIRHARVRKLGKVVFVFNKWMIDRPVDDVYFDNIARFLYIVLTDDRYNKRGKYSL